ncbi:MAG: hypothetical protein B6D46_11605 [Polyangiaceae bacterium UTPRO1]|nr:MFS transporter [Myxococcales bacterium]OQY66115.1 MAG: hypothetical protein B6D46_11605 [Polyangiaceae bacterium UTPRO1]
MTAADRRLVAVLGLAIFFEGYGRMLVPVALAFIGTDLGAAPDALSYALATIALGSFGVLALGPVADRLGRRRLLLASIMLFALFGAGTALATSLAGLVAWQLTARVFQESALFTAAVLAAEEASPPSRAAAQGWLGTVNALGAAFAALLLAAIGVVPGGWRGLACVSLAPLALAPLLHRHVPESRHWLTHSGPRVAFPPRAWRGRVAATLVVVALAMSYDVAAFAFATYVPVARHGWSAAQVSAMFIGAGACGLPGWSVGGLLADRYGRRPIAVIFLLGLTAAELLFFLGGRRALWPGFAAMVFFQGGKMTIIRAWAAELFPTSFRGAAAGWLTAAGAAGGMGGLAAAGALARAAGGIDVALAIGSSAGVLAAAAVFAWLPETRGVLAAPRVPEAG